MKKFWIAGLVALALVGALITGGVVWAHGGGGKGSGGESFASRVAEILELEESDVQDAFKEAKRDIRDERFQGRMDRRVEEGNMTQEEADAAVEWYESRPDNIGEGRQGRKSHWKGRSRSDDGAGSRFGGRRGFRGS